MGGEFSKKLSIRITPDMAERVALRQTAFTPSKQNAIIVDWVGGMGIKELAAKHKIAGGRITAFLREVKAESDRVLRQDAKR